jgi:hypothetical protein
MFVTSFALISAAILPQSKAEQKVMRSFVQVYDFSDLSHISYRLAVNMVNSQ